MAIHNQLFQLRNGLKLSQAEFGKMLGISQQTVQKWETGAAVPTLEKVISIAKKTGVSIDALALDYGMRTVEELRNQKILPNYNHMSAGELYSENLQTEYQQSVDEGKSVAEYRNLFSEVGKMPRGESKEKMADVLYHIVLNAPTAADYPFREPSDLEGIKALRVPYEISAKAVDDQALFEKIYGAWMGRICGCLLGKTVEGARTDELIPFLKLTGNYPLKKYIFRSEFTDEDVKHYKFGFSSRPYADVLRKMPFDDDTNYTVLYQELIRKYGRNFTSGDVLTTWVELQPKSSYFTAERIAYRNFINGFEAPDSAIYKNPCREWIGAQIRADYFGYINIGKPELAAEMAYRDAVVSHVKNGIYGEMFVAAMIAVAGVADNIREIIMGGLAQIPSTSRLYSRVLSVLHDFENGVEQRECFRKIHHAFNEYDTHGWCHTIPNAMIVAASLLYGRNDFGTSVCMAVETGFDTDCNAATVGSVLGMKNGIRSIGESWREPINDTLETTVFGVGTVSVRERAELTLQHIREA